MVENGARWAGGRAVPGGSALLVLEPPRVLERGPELVGRPVSNCRPKSSKGRGTVRGRGARLEPGGSAAGAHPAGGKHPLLAGGGGGTWPRLGARGVEPRAGVSGGPPPGAGPRRRECHPLAGRRRFLGPGPRPRCARSGPGRVGGRRGGAALL